MLSPPRFFVKFSLKALELDAGVARRLSSDQWVGGIVIIALRILTCDRRPGRRPSTSHRSNLIVNDWLVGMWLVGMGVVWVVSVEDDTY